MVKRCADEIREAAVIVVGSGLAGMVTALKLRPARVILVTRSRIGEGSSSSLAQGGIAAAVAENDHPGLHADDTESVGKGLSDERMVRIITEAAPQEVNWLTEIGARFDLQEDGFFSLGKEGAHSRRRILHAQGDKTGWELVRSLKAAVWASSHIEVLENSLVADLVKEEGRVSGIILRRGDGAWVRVKSPVTVFATGGVGALFGQTTNPEESTGDGLAMAFRAGAALADMEFVQFHPTALYSEKRPLPLLTEALRGEGAVLVDDQGHRFMKEIHPMGELAPRDVVSRAIWNRRRKGIQVFLDCTPIWNEGFPSRFPTVMDNCRDNGLDPSKDPIPVVTAAHYHIGGILTGPDGRTTLPGLWACGEAAATMIHGANRLASNSLLEALIVGSRVATDIREHGLEFPRGKVSSGEISIEWSEARPELNKRITEIMWSKVGLLRCGASLGEALEELEDLERKLGEGLSWERNMVTVGTLIARSALMRKESRGVHYRTDYPSADPYWNKHICQEGDSSFTVSSGSEPMEEMQK